jgi:hypothetical protein
MADLNPFWLVVVMASTVLLGTVAGSAVHSFFDHLVQKWQIKNIWRLKALKQEAEQ